MIRRGEAWGHATVMPDKVNDVDSDASLGSSDASEPVFVSHGDIARSIGNPSRPPSGSDCTEISIDAMKCTILKTEVGDIVVNAASSIVVGSFWKGRNVIVSNAGWLKNSNVAPRAHPNDGVVEVLNLSSSMSLRQRALARRKMLTGTHLPHPEISMSRESSFRIDRTKNEKLMIDGIRIPNWSEISIEVVPDYWRVLL